jgi:hypothetical protein
MEKINDIFMEGAEIAYSNFLGKPTKFKPEGGVRTVTFVIPDEMVADLKAQGWRVRAEIRDEQIYRYLLDTKFIFETRNHEPFDPRIFIINSSRRPIHITEENVNVLNRADIVNVDVQLHAVPYDFGNAGITPFINHMLVYVNENPLEKKLNDMLDNYSDSDDSGIDDLPFPIPD